MIVNEPISDKQANTLILIRYYINLGHVQYYKDWLSMLKSLKNEWNNYIHTNIEEVLEADFVLASKLLNNVLSMRHNSRTNVFVINKYAELYSVLSRIDSFLTELRKKPSHAQTFWMKSAYNILLPDDKKVDKN